MTTATDLAALPREEQYALVYAGICAVSSHCDGAVSEDGVGFNGQDTKFGKRIASVPFEAWTDDVKVEAARIALTYKQQILSYLGIDMFELPVVKEASGHDTNRQARDDARSFEKMARNKVTLDGGRIVFDFPFNAEIKDALKAAGARWNGDNKTWWVAQVSPEVKAIAAKWFNVTDSAEFWRLIEAAMPTPAAPAKPAVHGYMISDEIVFSFPYNPGQKDAIKAAGARWNGTDKTWRVRATDPKAPAVVAAARQVGLTVAKEVDSALGNAPKVAAAKLDRATTLVGASRCSRPNEVTPEFLALVAQAVK